MSPERPWAGSDRAYLGSLASGQTLAADFYFDIDESASSPKANSVPLTVKYEADQVKKVENRVIVYVTGKASFTIDSADMPIKISPSDTGVVPGGLLFWFGRRRKLVD